MTPDLAARLAGRALDVAPTLLGMVLSTEIEGRTCSVRLDEVEAYGGSDDPASHAFRGLTARNAPMFGPPGTLYVYRSYGVHWCTNIVTGASGDPQAVLLRGGEPREGHEFMEERRGKTSHLADGPGRLSQALGIDLSDNATVVGAGRVHLVEGADFDKIITTPRIGISKAVDRRWRFTGE